MTLLLLKWLARLAALVVFGGYVVLIIGEFTHPHSGPPTKFMEWFSISLFAVAMISVMAAWKWELQGALLSLCALLSWVLIVRMSNYGVVWVAASPGILFLAHWLAAKFMAKPT